MDFDDFDDQILIQCLFNPKMNKFKDDNRIRQVFEEYLGDFDSVSVQFYATFEIQISYLGSTHFSSRVTVVTQNPFFGGG